MKTTTIRISEELDRCLTMYAKQNDLSRNQVIKIALRKLFNSKQLNGNQTGGDANESRANNNPPTN